MEQDLVRRHRATHLVGVDQGLCVVCHHHGECVLGGGYCYHLGAMYTHREGVAPSSGGAVLAEGGPDQIQHLYCG